MKVSGNIHMTRKCCWLLPLGQGLCIWMGERPSVLPYNPFVMLELKNTCTFKTENDSLI